MRKHVVMIFIGFFLLYATGHFILRALPNLNFKGASLLAYRMVEPVATQDMKDLVIDYTDVKERDLEVRIINDVLDIRLTYLADDTFQGLQDTIKNHYGKKLEITSSARLESNGISTRFLLALLAYSFLSLLGMALLIGGFYIMKKEKSRKY